MPNIFAIAGPNGSGKTTTAMQLLPNFLGVIEYVNADEIAAGLSPFNPESVAIQAGKLAIYRLQTISDAGIDFAFETTLSSRFYVRFLSNCKEKGYRINLIYFWLDTPELAVARVRKRVESGGHNIPEEVIRRRYQRGQKNLIDLYLPLCDSWIIYNNTKSFPELVAFCNDREQSTPLIYQPQIWNQINQND